jgi:4-hydroxy-tetrahydrodipicolinate synthase
MSVELGAIVTAMVTPFDVNGELDLAEAQRLARWLVKRGNDGLVVAGSTGEGQTLDAGERVALWRSIKEGVGGDAVVIANAGTNSTRESIAAVEAAEAAGVDAILAVVPYYNKPTQRGMLEHFGALAEATALPIVIYNIPGRTGANMLPETLLELAGDYANIAGVKESSGDLKQIGTIIAGRRPGFIVWSGDDHLFLPCLALGADGVVGVASHLCSPEYRRMFDAYRAGRVAEAAQIHASLLPLVDACRLPLDEIPLAVADRLRPLLAPYASHPVESR